MIRSEVTEKGRVLQMAGNECLKALFTRMVQIGEGVMRLLSCERRSVMVDSS